MHAKLNLPLMIAVVSWVFFSPVDLYAQDAAPAVIAPTIQPETDSPPAAAPVTVVDAQAVASGHELVVLELFSSQACVFCPKADQLFSDLVKLDNVIGLACHVDYFDVRAGSLSRPFCTARQNWYMQALGAGPNYTPQMIVNGITDVVGYKADDVKAAIDHSQQSGAPVDIKITKGTAANDFTLSWDGKATTTETEPAVMWLMLLDKPHDLDISEGRNKGQKLSYVNIVSDMEDRGAWDVAGQSKTIQVTLNQQQAGFVIIAQDKKSGKILAAGQYKKPE